MENERFLAGILPDLGIRIVPKDRIQHVRNMKQLVAAIARECRIVKPTWNEFNPYAFQAFFLKRPSHFVFDRSPLSENIDAFLIFFEHPFDEHNPDSLFEQWIFIEGIADD